MEIRPYEYTVEEREAIRGKFKRVHECICYERYLGR
jgi:hypothetical protein